MVADIVQIEDMEMVVFELGLKRITRNLAWRKRGL
jgi:hypothetical protein